VRPAREQLLTVTADDRDAVVVLTVDDAVDRAVDALTVPRLRDALRSPFDRLDGRVLVVDLTAVRFLGSPGLRALAEGATEAARHRGAEPLRVVADHNRPVIGPLEIVGLLVSPSIARDDLDAWLLFQDCPRGRPASSSSPSARPSPTASSTATRSPRTSTTTRGSCAERAFLTGRLAETQPDP
jgi:anti-sigma B factor antagonist